MVRTALGAQVAIDTGLTPAYSAANVDGHSVEPGVLVHVKNGGAGTCTITVPTPGTVRGKAIADTTIAIPAGQERMIGGLVADLYGQLTGADEGRVYVDFSVVTSVTVAAFRQ